MKFWNFVNNQQNENEIELRITGDIISDGDAWFYEWFGIPAASPNAFRNELAKHKGKNIIIWVDSNGGDVYAGAGMYNALMEHTKSGGKITAKIENAMSAATIPVMAADEIWISPVGMFMIHNPVTYLSGGWGEEKDFRHAADVLSEVKETIMNAYQTKTGKTRNKISELMDNETYMSAKTAVKLGFADKIMYSDNQNQNEPIENNLMLSRLAIFNSMDITKQKFIEFAKNNLRSAQQTAAPKPQSDANNNPKGEGDEPMFKDVVELRNAYPELVKQIEDAAREDGKKQERSRIQDIEKISKNISPELVNKAKFEEPMDAKELAFQAMQKDDGKGQQYLQNMQQDFTASGAAGVNGNPVNQQSSEQKKEEEEKDGADIANAANRKRGVR